MLFKQTKETRNFEECHERDDESVVAHQNISHGDALAHIEAVLNYSLKGDEIPSAGKTMVRNLLVEE